MIRHYAQWFMLLAALTVLVAVVLYSGHGMEEAARKPATAAAGTAPEERPDVSVVTVRTGTYTAHAQGYAAARPHYELTLTAAVSGRVASLGGDFETGRQVRKGDVLARLEDAEYQAGVASAQHDLASARQDLLEAERERDQAREEWDASGMDGEPDSALVLHEPQVRTARSAVADAGAALADARQDLAHTRIDAPFDALVVSRAIAPGSYVQAGGEIATLYSTDRVEIEVPLADRDWANLPDTDTLADGEWPVTLTDVAGGNEWSGHVLRIARHRDDTTRQRSVIVAVDHPLSRTPPLLPGTFVQARISGRRIDGLWRLPPAALSQRSEIWYVTGDGALASFSAEPVFSDSDAIYVRPPETLAGAAQQVVTHPLGSYLAGMAVNPVETEAAGSGGGADE
ncbi:Multidrug resistance protein MdtA [wastewater metagenome]|uniref:Multidrug resistance protein MdtA n=2 Tax=unclassified sequences TaxID=12908 RepID=A0A5B8R629_9ZZZZ|nr:efflux RND transporter periplasmic adaptor subunit [Arhodomonas sp. KWT]QEA04379.1 multidrug resistance protein MdtA [uncultured organism]